MVTATRDSWLDCGLKVLATDGITGLRISDLAASLSVTKGSFYHHFVDLADFRRCILAHFEKGSTTRYIQANQLLDGLSPPDRLLALADAVLDEEEAHRGLEVNVRSWASQNDDAHDTLERIDFRRMAYLTELAVGIVGDSTRAPDLATSIYFLLVGSQHAIPPGSADQLRRLWEHALEAALTDHGPR